MKPMFPKETEDRKRSFRRLAFPKEMIGPEENLLLAGISETEISEGIEDEEAELPRKWSLERCLLRESPSRIRIKS